MSITTEYRGFTLLFDEKRDVWYVRDGHAAVPAGKLPDVKLAIDAWDIEAQKAAGTPVWVVDHDDPSYWRLSVAVFRRGDDAETSRASWNRKPMEVLFRNGSDPSSLYGRGTRDCAPDTPEVAAAIAEARAAYADLVEASKRCRAARYAVPKMTADDWVKLRDVSELTARHEGE